MSHPAPQSQKLPSVRAQYDKLINDAEHKLNQALANLGALEDEGKELSAFIAYDEASKSSQFQHAKERCDAVCDAAAKTRDQNMQHEREIKNKIVQTNASVYEKRIQALKRIADAAAERMAGLQKKAEELAKDITKADSESSKATENLALATCERDIANAPAENNYEQKKAALMRDFNCVCDQQTKKLERVRIAIVHQICSARKSVISDWKQRRGIAIKAVRAAHAHHVDRVHALLRWDETAQVTERKLRIAPSPVFMDETMIHRVEQPVQAVQNTKLHRLAVRTEKLATDAINSTDAPSTDDDSSSSSSSGSDGDISIVSKRRRINRD